MDLFYKEKGHCKGKQIVFAVVLLVLLIPVFVVAIYSRPVADDYNYSIQVFHEIEENGVSLGGLLSSAMETNLAFYQQWQGLYTTAFILALQPGVFGEQYYGLTTVIMLLMIYLTFVLSAKWLLEALLPKARYSVPLLALFLTFFVVQNMPSPLEGLYWYNGAMNYLPFCLLTLLNILLLGKLHLCQSVRRENVLLGISVLLSFLISGGNHVTSFLNLLAMAGIFALSCLRKKYKVGFSFLSALVGFCIMLAAPGTAQRAQAMNAQTGVRAALISVCMGLMQGFGMMLTWFDLGMIGFLILLTPLCLRIVKENRFQLSFACPLLPIVFSGCVMGAMWCIPYYAGLAWFGEGRVYNVVWVTFVVLVLGCYTYFLGWLVHRLSLQVQLPNTRWRARFIYGFFLLAAMSGIMLSGKQCGHISVYGMSPATSIVACMDLYQGDAQRYAAQMDARIALYQDASLDEVAVDPIADYPYLLYFSDITPEADFWSNVSISEYYGKTIYLNQPQENLGW